MANFDQVIFGKKTFSDLLKNIYDNSNKSEKQISEFIQALKPFITNAGEAVMIVPLIKEYLEVKVKNDEQLVKMAGIVQRAMSNSNNGDGSGDIFLSDEEMKQLMSEVQKVGDSAPKVIEVSIPKQLELR